MSSAIRVIQFGLWVACVAGGFGYLASYETTPGRDASAPKTWPTSSRLERLAGQPTMVVFAHARCPCTRATIGELERLMVDANGRATVHVLLFDPDVPSGAWVETDLWNSAAAIPGVRAARDLDRREALLFGAVTSGQVVLYGADDRLLFLGGITASRGHAGDSAGHRALVELIHGRQPGLAATPVFGCSLTDPCCASTHDDETP